MAQTRVFVDDAVLGRLPGVCAQDGVATTARLTVVQEVGATSRIGVLWLLVFLGPVGWIVLLFLSLRDSGEHLSLELPYSNGAYRRLVAARRLRNLGIAIASLGTLAVAMLAAQLDVLALGQLLVVGTLLTGFGIGARGGWLVSRESVEVTLDASRRWVTLAGVHPVFATACAEAATEPRRV